MQEFLVTVKVVMRDLRHLHTLDEVQSEVQDILYQIDDVSTICIAEVQKVDEIL